MGAELQNFEVDAAASLLAWWRDAGVDVAVGEEPHNWLGAPAAKSHRTSVSAVGPKAGFPSTHAAFVEWLKTADLPDAGPSLRRVGPSGSPASSFMVLADMPDTNDVEAGKLMSGELEVLFDDMLGALSLARNSIYLATLSPGRPPTGRISGDAMQRYADIARHHIRLVGPKKLWLMGTAASRALLGMADAEAKGRLHSINLDGATIEVIATAHPRSFESVPGSKRAAWIEMQRLITKDHA